jgi:hypothetical protein
MVSVNLFLIPATELLQFETMFIMLVSTNYIQNQVKIQLYQISL